MALLASSLDSWVAAAAACVALLLTSRSIHRSNLIASAQLVDGLFARFDSDAGRRERRHLASKLSPGGASGEGFDLRDSYPPLSLLEEVGHLTRRGVLDAAMVNDRFGWWIVMYHTALTRERNYITEAQTQSGRYLFSELRWLAGNLASVRRTERRHIEQPRQEDLARFLRDEAGLSAQ